MQEPCRLPRTATRRNAVCYCKLLDRVDAAAVDGFGYVGRFLRPGDLIDVGDLARGPGRAAVILESTQVEGDWGARRRRRWEQLYILWRYDPAGWIEIARCQSQSADWAVQLREAARIALGRENWSIVPKTAEVSQRIRGLLDRELDSLNQAQRREVLADLHDQFAARMIASAEVA